MCYPCRTLDASCLLAACEADHDAETLKLLPGRRPKLIEALGSQNQLAIVHTLITSFRS
jgi:hypothetical protein